MTAQLQIRVIRVVTPSGFGLHSQCAMPLFKTKTVREYRNNIQHGTIDTLWFKSRQDINTAENVKNL